VTGARLSCKRPVEVLEEEGGGPEEGGRAPLAGVCRATPEAVAVACRVDALLLAVARPGGAILLKRLLVLARPCACACACTCTWEARTKSPCSGTHEKYCWPATLPSFLPSGAPSSTPTHSPDANYAVQARNTHL